MVTVVSTSREGPLHEYTCAECGKNVITSSQDIFCPWCYSEAPEQSDSKKEITSSTKDLRFIGACQTCGKSLYSNSEKSDEELQNILYCPFCGSAEIGGEQDKPEEEDDLNKDDDCIDKDEEKEEDKQEEIEKEVDDVKDKVSSKIEAVLLSSPQPTWIFFKESSPIFKLVLSKINDEVKPFFTNHDFVEILQNRAKETSLASTIKEFGGEVFNTPEVINSLDLEELAYNKLHAQIMPKFQDCLALAIEGASKGVYPDLHRQLKSSFYEEFVTRGFPEDTCVGAIEAAFIGAGPEVFTAIIAKGTELLNKSKSAYKEIKSTIQKAGFVRGVPTVTEDDIQHKQLVGKVNNGNVPLEIVGSISNGVKIPLRQKSVDVCREKISFRR